MRADEAKKRYQMNLIAENSTTYMVTVIPLLEIDKESFSKAIIQLDRKYLLPTNIVLIAPDGKSTQDYKFSDVKPNAVVPPATSSASRWTRPGRWSATPAAKARPRLRAGRRWRTPRPASRPSPPSAPGACWDVVRSTRPSRQGRPFSWMARDSVGWGLATRSSTLA